MSSAAMDYFGGVDKSVDNPRRLSLDSDPNTEFHTTAEAQIIGSRWHTINLGTTALNGNAILKRIIAPILFCFFAPLLVIFGIIVSSSHDDVTIADMASGRGRFKDVLFSFESMGLIGSFQTRREHLQNKDEDSIIAKATIHPPLLPPSLHSHVQPLFVSNVSHADEFYITSAAIEEICPRDSKDFDFSSKQFEDEMLSRVIGLESLNNFDDVQHNVVAVELDSPSVVVVVDDVDDDDDNATEYGPETTVVDNLIFSNETSTSCQDSSISKVSYPSNIISKKGNKRVKAAHHHHLNSSNEDSKSLDASGQLSVIINPNSILVHVHVTINGTATSQNISFPIQQLRWIVSLESIPVKGFESVYEKQTLDITWERDQSNGYDDSYTNSSSKTHHFFNCQSHAWFEVSMLDRWSGDAHPDRTIHYFEQTVVIRLIRYVGREDDGYESHHQVFTVKIPAESGLDSSRKMVYHNSTYTIELHDEINLDESNHSHVDALTCETNVHSHLLGLTIWFVGLVVVAGIVRSKFQDKAPSETKQNEIESASDSSRAVIVPVEVVFSVATEKRNNFVGDVQRSNDGIHAVLMNDSGRDRPALHLFPAQGLSHDHSSSWEEDSHCFKACSQNRNIDRRSNIKTSLDQSTMFCGTTVDACVSTGQEYHSTGGFSAPSPYSYTLSRDEENLEPEYFEGGTGVDGVNSTRSEKCCDTNESRKSDTPYSPPKISRTFNAPPFTKQPPYPTSNVTPISNEQSVQKKFQEADHSKPRICTRYASNELIDEGVVQSQLEYPQSTNSSDMKAKRLGREQLNLLREHKRTIYEDTHSSLPECVKPRKKKRSLSAIGSRNVKGLSPTSTAPATMDMVDITGSKQKSSLPETYDRPLSLPRSNKGQNKKTALCSARVARDREDEISVGAISTCSDEAAFPLRRSKCEDDDEENFRENRMAVLHHKLHERNDTNENWNMNCGDADLSNENAETSAIKKTKVMNGSKTRKKLSRLERKLLATTKKPSIHIPSTSLIPLLLDIQRPVWQYSHNRVSHS